MRYLSHWLSFLITFTISFVILAAITTVTPPASAQTSFLTRWNSWFRNAPPPRRPISRGDGFCPVAVSPGQDNLIWSKQPVLTWLGAVEKMELRAVNETGTLWDYSSTDVNPDVNQGAFVEIGNRRVYSVALPSLRPDVTYQLRVYDQPDTEPMNMNLRLLSAAERERISQDLQQLDSSALTNPTQEAISLERAGYFASENLWSSFWQELLSVQDPSPELKEILQATLTEVCPDP